MVDFVTYQWVVFLHIFGVFVFLLAHGVSSGVGSGSRRNETASASPPSWTCPDRRIA